MAATPVVVIGAGLAGLAAATRLAATRADVTLYEASGQAGGRCRSFRDRELGRRLDNGAHIVLGANKHVGQYLAELGTADRLQPVEGFPMHDLASGARWRFAPGPGPLWRVTDGRAPAGAKPGLGALPLLWARDRPVAQALAWTRTAYDKFWAPLTTAALNTAPEEADPALLRRTLAAGFLRGRRGSRAWLARESLDASFIAPALMALEAIGATIRFKTRLRAIESRQGRAEKLIFADGSHRDVSAAAVVLAVPATAAGRLLPELTVPTRHNAICNIHYRLPEGVSPTEGLLGVIGGTAQWLVVRGDVVSVTVSAADRLMDHAPAELAGQLWPEVAAALALPADRPVPAYRVVKERRATIAQTPGHSANRPALDRPGLANLVLAGDWTDTGLPASIEGAIRSGHQAATSLGRRGFL